MTFGNDALAGAIDAVIARPLLEHTLFGIQVHDLDAGGSLYALNAGKFFKAASTTKIVTEGVALGTLGRDFRFTTPVYRMGPIDADGVLHGDVVLVASGDPNLSQRLQPDGRLAFEGKDHSYDGSPLTKAVPGDPLAALRNIAAQIAAKGVKSITGRVLVDTSIFTVSGAETGTGAYLSSVVVNDNLIDILVTPGMSVGDPVTISVSPQTSYASVSTRAVTGAAKSEDTLKISDAPDELGNRVVTLSGSVPISDPPILYVYRVPEPDRFAAAALTRALLDAGVALALPARSEPFDVASYAANYIPENVMAEHVSAPLREETKVALKVSQNLHSSLKPYILAAYAANATTNQLQSGFDVERAFLENAGLDVSQATQSDGLGGDAYFTPDFMVSYLTWISTQAWYRDFYDALPVLGRDGSLAEIQTQAPAAGEVHAKDGTWQGSDKLNQGSMMAARGLVGYVTVRRGHRVVFAVYLNRLQFKGRAMHMTGEILGEIANAIYLHA